MKRALVFLTLLTLPGCAMFPSSLDRHVELCLNADGSFSYSDSRYNTRFECDRGTFGRDESPTYR